MQRSHVLFVDDEPNILAAFARQLRGVANIKTACGPESGMEAIESELQFKVVVVDMQMPGMNGIEFLRHVRDKQPKAVRVMLTGNADSETAERAKSEAGIFRFLLKPCNGADLITAITEAINQYEEPAAA